VNTKGAFFSSIWKNPRCRVGMGFAGVGILLFFLGGQDLLKDPLDEFARWVMYIGFVFFLPGALIVMGVWRSGKTALALADKGIIVRALITDVKKDWLSRGYALRYRFNDAMGRTYSGKKFLPQQEAFTWREGEESEVRFDPNDPTRSVWIGRAVEFDAEGSSVTVPATVIEVTGQNAERDEKVVVRYRYRNHLGQIHEGGFIEDKGVVYKAGDTGEVECYLRHPDVSRWLGKSDHAIASGDMAETASFGRAWSEAPIFVPASLPSAFKLVRRSKSLKTARLTFFYFCLFGVFLFTLAVFKESPDKDDQIGFTLYSLLVAGVFVFFVKHLWAGIREVREWQRIASRGSAAEGTVVLVEQVRKNLRRGWTWSPGWVVSYRYRDDKGMVHTGDSGYLSRKEAAKWRFRDKCVILCDSEHPEKSVWIGRS
jgi:hypothetical protein